MKFKLLIAVDKSRFFHLKQFGDTLKKYGIDYKLVDDLAIYDKSFFTKKYLRWLYKPKNFERIIKEYKPDAVFTERVSHFSLLTAKAKIPLLLFLRGDYWNEIALAKKTMHTSAKKYLELWVKQRIADKCFKNSTIIITICKYLENIVKEHYENKTIETMYQGIEISDWYSTKGMELKHPCVGLLQGAHIWGKVKEMLILPEILEAMPHVTFYWAGDGPYKNEILKSLKKYENFVWLGAVSYPEGVRDFLSEIDVYALFTGLDMSPHTILEAALMKKPIIATNTGGVPESIIEGRTGFMVEIGDRKEWIEKLSILLNDKKLSSQLSIAGYEFVMNNFSWDKIGSDFIKLMNKHLQKKRE